MKVTNTVLEKLITLVQEHPCLYDVRSNEHKDAIKVANVWASIADIIIMDDRLVSRVWFYYNILYNYIISLVTVL